LKSKVASLQEGLALLLSAQHLPADTAAALQAGLGKGGVLAAAAGKPAVSAAAAGADADAAEGRGDELDEVISAINKVNTAGRQ
jgi:hypothetical protein